MPIHYAPDSPFSPLCTSFPPHGKAQRAQRQGRGSFHISHVYTKYVTRQVTVAWKRITRSTRKHERASVLPEGFVIINHTRRKSIFFK